MTKLKKALNHAFCTNFMLYFKSHVAHVNISGEDFLQFHEFLGEIYEDAQSSIDTYAEFLRILKEPMPVSLTEIMACSDVMDNLSLTVTDYKDYNNIFANLYTDVELLIDVLNELYVQAEENSDFGLSGFVQDRLRVHKKQCWKLRMLLEPEDE